MRVASLLLGLALSVVFVFDARAGVDCNVAKNTMAPVEMSYHTSQGARIKSQSFRDKSGDYVVWTRSESGAGVFVTKAVLIDGRISESQDSYTVSGQLKINIRKFTLSGYPANFDRKSNIQYTTTVDVTFPDNSRDSGSSKTSYTFKSEGKMAVGSCVLTVVHGETETTDAKTGAINRTFQLYFPELKLSAVSAGSEPTIDDLNTDVVPFTPGR